MCQEILWIIRQIKLSKIIIDWRKCFEEKQWLKKEISHWDANVERIIRKVFSEEEMFTLNKKIGKSVPDIRNPKERIPR